MASTGIILHLALFLSLLSSSLGTSRLAESTQPKPMAFEYHRGHLLSGKIPINLIWYGHFVAAQRTIVSDFIASMSSSGTWNSMGKYHRLANPKKPISPSVELGKQVVDETFTLGKSLTSNHLVHWLPRAAHRSTPSTWC